jgi:hypothetical protein
MKLFAERLERIRVIRGFASIDVTGNAGDVLELPASRAREMVEAGLAEPTSASVGRATTTLELKTCPRCSFEQSFYNARCEVCNTSI